MCNIPPANIIIKKLFNSMFIQCLKIRYYNIVLLLHFFETIEYISTISHIIEKYSLNNVVSI